MQGQRSPIKDIEIKRLLKNAFTDKINDREAYRKGIDEGCRDEGCHTYKTNELDENKEI